MNATRIFIAKIFATLLLATSVHAAETPNDFKCGPIDCDTLKNDPDARFVKMIDDAKDGKPQLLDHIAELRKRFWEMYDFDSTSKDCDNAREQFAQALFEKDLHYLQPNVIARVYAPNPHRLTGEQEDLPTQLADLLTGGVDGGIPRSAQPEFYAWVNAMRDALGPARTFDDHFRLGLQAGGGILSADYRKAMNLGGKEYQEYVMERDWAEFAAINRVPAGYNHKETYGVFLYFRPGNNSFRDANIIYAGMEEALGKNAVQAAAESVRTAPKTEGGDLVKNVGYPEKIGPSGSPMPDYDAPVPPGVIGVYKDPALALEILATQDDDRRYALYLLKHQYWKNASSIKQANNEWTFAAALYKQLAIAFGEQNVLETARLVRTATKRWISGNVMDQKAIGATRNVPLEAFEDILARKNPKGYVRATLAFDQDLLTPEAVDVAYQKLTAASSEKAVLEAAQKTVAGKPLFGYRFELREFVQAMNAPPTSAQPAQPLYDFPEYLAWKGFAPGAKASYVSHVWRLDPPGSDHLISGPPTSRHTFTLRSLNDDQELFWLTEIEYDASGRASPAHDSEFTYPAKVAAPTRRFQGRKGRGGAASEEADAPAPAPPTTTAEAAVAPRRRRALILPATEPMQSGEEVLEINGKKIATRWQSLSFPFKPDPRYGDGVLVVKVWTSDAVPSGLVRRTEDRRIPAGPSRRAQRFIEETSLESFEGAKPGVAAPDASAPATTAYVPPPVALGGAVPAEAKSAPVPALSPRALNPDLPASAPGVSQADAQAAAALNKEVHIRFNAVYRRSARVRVQLNRWVRQNAAQGIELPADISDARARLDVELREAQPGSAQMRDADQARKKLDAVEATVAELEKFVSQQLPKSR